MRTPMIDCVRTICTLKSTLIASPANKALATSNATICHNQLFVLLINTLNLQLVSISTNKSLTNEILQVISFMFPSDITL